MKRNGCIPPCSWYGIPSGKAVLPRRTLNLEFIDSAGLSAQWGISEIVDPAAVQIDVRRILLEELQLR